MWRINLLLATLFFVSSATYCKCPVDSIEVHGNIVGNLTSGLKVSLALIFKHDRNQPKVEFASIKDGGFAQSLDFFTLSRSGFLFAEWGERCDRKPEQVVIRLAAADGTEIDKVELSVRKDFAYDLKTGFTLRSPVVLRSKS